MHFFVNKRGSETGYRKVGYLTLFCCSVVIIVFIFQVDGSVRKLFKSGKDLDDTLTAVVIRNLKIIQVRSYFSIWISGQHILTTFYTLNKLMEVHDRRKES